MHICLHNFTILGVVAFFAESVLCQLTVQPNGTVFHRSLGDNIVFTCSLDLPAGSVIVNIQWLDQNRVEILDKSPGRDKYDFTNVYILPKCIVEITESSESYAFFMDKGC